MTGVSLCQYTKCMDRENLTKKKSHNFYSLVCPDIVLLWYTLLFFSTQLLLLVYNIIIIYELVAVLAQLNSPYITIPIYRGGPLARRSQRIRTHYTYYIKASTKSVAQNIL